MDLPARCFNEAAGYYPRKQLLDIQYRRGSGHPRFNEAAGYYPRKRGGGKRKPSPAEEASMRPRGITRGNPYYEPQTQSQIYPVLQ